MIRNNFMPVLLAAFIFLITNDSAASGTELVDSLKRELPHLHDTAKVHVLSDLCFYHARIDLDLALEYGEQALALSNKINDQRGVAGTLANIANVYQKIGEYDKAVDIYKEAINILREHGSQEYLSATLNNLGSLYIQLEKFNKAYTVLNEGLKIREEMDDKRGVSSSLINLASVYLEWKLR